MKRFLLYLVIAIAVVSLGLTIYYFSTDNEAIYIKSSYMVINKGESISTLDSNNELLDFKHRSQYTTLKYTSENEEILSYNESEFYFVGEAGGQTKIVITTNNRSYSKFIVDVLVCDGSAEYPYIVKTEEDLNNIREKQDGSDKYNYELYNYKLGNDIEMQNEWLPIPTYGNTFDGNYFTIKNMHITEDSENIGFVAILEKTGVIKNLFLEDLVIDCSATNMGAYAGTSHGTIQTSEVISGTVKNNKTNGTNYVGGVAGVVSSETGVKTKVDRCGFEGVIETASNTNTYVGGVVGQNQSGLVSENYSRGLVKNNSCKFGGIVGLNQSTIFPADVYDNYFYLKEADSATTKANMKGVVYSKSDDNGIITGNYFGGVAPTDELNAGVNGSNGYLTQNEFKVENNFVTAVYSGSDKRTWNFDTVWEIPNNANYPILNVYSSVGSTYLINVGEIEDATLVESAEDLYNALCDDNANAKYKVANDINCASFVWGTNEHPIPYQFKGILVNGTTDAVTHAERPCEIKNLTIKNDYVIGSNGVKKATTNGSSSVGLVQYLSSSAIVSGLVINNTTITKGSFNNTADYVGVIAGGSMGAHIYEVKIASVNISLPGKGFGGVCGYANNYEGHAIENVSVSNIQAQNAYYEIAGGIVGSNYGTIATGKKTTYNTVTGAQFYANMVGGIAGANGGKIYNANAQGISFNVPSTTASAQDVYSGTYDVFVGGIVGQNEAIKSGVRYKGEISDVYANLTCKAHTSNTYGVYVGGVAGYNTNYIVRAYVNALDVAVTGSHSTLIGGIAGYNAGRISNSVVNSESKIVAPTTSSIPATENYVLKVSNCSIVGGIVGYDAQTSNSTYSIYQCACLANTIQGYYAGGISGISFGKVEYSYCGESTVTDGGVTIKGYMIGGISAVIAGGFVNNCYTFCKLNVGSDKFGTYKDVTSTLNMDVRSMGGISVFVFNKNTKVTGCYAAVTFAGNGVSYGSCADGYNGGIVKNCAYTTVGYIKTSVGTQISKANLHGNDGYRAFKKAIGDVSVWELSGYPTLAGVNVRLPNSTLPTM